MKSLIFIAMALIAFSAVWLGVWLWFFKSNKAPVNNSLKEAEKAFEKNDYKKAKDLLLKVKDLNTNPSAKYELGIAHLHLNEYEEAKACFEQVLKTSPKNFDALSNLAQTLQLQGKYDESLEAYTKAIAENSKHIGCYLNVGNIYSEQEKHDKALETFEKAKEVSPENNQVLFSIAKCKIELCDVDDEDQYKQLIEECAKLAGSDNLPPDGHKSLAKLCAKSGDVDQALEYCKKAIEKNEKDVDAYKLLGLIQLIKDDVAGAKNSLSMALNFQPKSLEAHNIFSYLLCRQDDRCERNKCRAKYYKLIEKHLE